MLNTILLLIIYLVTLVTCCFFGIDRKDCLDVSGAAELS